MKTDGRLVRLFNTKGGISMKSYAADKVRNVVLLGHSGSGKTTYAEAALFYSGATKRFGKVDEGNTVSDYDPEEIRRKVSISTSVLPVEWQDTKINFLDTPGYFDFVAESKLAMSVADTALIMVSAKSGVEVGTEKAWEYTEEMHLPRIFFVNQMDDENADFEKTLADMRVKFGKSVAPLQIPFNDADGKFVGFINLIKRDARKKVDGKLQPCEMPEDKKDEVEVLRSMLVEVAAESSDELMEKFFNDIELTEEEIYDGLKYGIENHTIAPVMCGSATLGYGVKLLLNTIVRFTPPANEAKPNFHAFHNGEKVVYCSTDDERFSAFVFKTIADPYIGRLNLFRVMTGKLDASMSVYNEEKDREIYVLLDLSPYMAFGSRFELKSVSAAKIAALIGWLGIENKDRFGAAIFDGTQTFFYRATNNRSTMPVILNKISSLTKDLLKKKSANGTQLNTALQMLNNYIKERASVFVISSFNMLGESEKKYLSQLSKKSRVFCVNVFDALEINAPIKGEYMIADGEGKNLIFNSGNKLFRAEYQQYFENRKTDFQNFCRRFRIAYAEISPAPDLYAQLKFY